MPKRTRKEALQSYIAPIKQSLLCVSGSVLAITNNSTLTFLPGGIGDLNGTDLRLRLAQKFSIVEDSEDGFKVKTDFYAYTLVDRHGEELLAYHWHPQKDLPEFPHVHVRGEFKRLHLPTGRVSIERVVEMLIREFGIAAVGEAWRHTLEGNRERFEQRRTWA